ncbi:MAG: hypothetical protein RL701_6123 [Pseudomonadota bacterium]
MQRTRRSPVVHSCAVSLLLAAVSGTACAPDSSAPASTMNGATQDAGSVTMGLATTVEADIYPCGRPAGVGTISDAMGSTWIVPADTKFADQGFPTASDLYNPCTKFLPENVATALAALRAEDIVTVDADGEVITAFVFADNYFELYINGVPVGKDAVPYTEFNSSSLRFRVKRPFVVALRAVDWETHLGLGSEPFIGGEYDPGDAGIVAVFRDASGRSIATTNASWKVQSYYISPLQDFNCVSQKGSLRDSSTCETTGTNDGSHFYALHWRLPDGWYERSFDDSAWLGAATYTNERVGVGNKPAFTKFVAIFDDPALDADFIWTSNLILDNEILARYTVP